MSFILGDWGTSHLRLFLCDSNGTVIDSINGPGAAEVGAPAPGGRFESIFTSLTQQWQNTHGGLSAVLSGMVGSSFGWVQAPYVPCPARLEQVAEHCVRPDGGAVSIVPGLSCRNMFDAPDFIRGEETQIIGALELQPELRGGRCLLCLPGTHTKWVGIVGGEVREFLTAPTGEIFAALRGHTVLVRGAPADNEPVDAVAFDEGVAQIRGFPQGTVLHRLFEVRSRQLDGEFGATEAAAFMSGLLIASDVRDASSLLATYIRDRIVLIGDPKLTRLYARACEQYGHAPAAMDGGTASLAGLLQIHRQLTQRGAAN